MGNESEVTHKELLTFSNLTNLKWEFADLSPEQKTDQDGNKYYEYDPLTDLLDPEMFVRYNADTDSYSYPYLEGKTGQNINLTDEEREQGLAQLRQEAGIAIEYLEKSEAGNTEGDFLKDWEVI